MFHGTPPQKGCQSNLHSLASCTRLNIHKNTAVNQRVVSIRDYLAMVLLNVHVLRLHFDLCWIRRPNRPFCYVVFECTNTRFSLPRKVLEMNSDTWFPDRLISDRCVNSRFNILLNCKRERGRVRGWGVGGGGEKNIVSFH